MGATPTAVVASLGLICGYAVAAGTGVRPLGGIVLLATAAWCAPRWRARAGISAAAVLLLVFAAVFALSHPWGHVVGAWPAVLSSAAVLAAAAWFVADRPFRQGRALAGGASDR